MLMLASAKCLLSSNHSPHLFHKRSGRKFHPRSSKKEDIGENSKAQYSFFPWRVSSAFLARSAIAVLGLGFIDAGYSGDWSRIGVISRDTEELLKVATYFVAPLCLFLIFSTSNREED